MFCAECGKPLPDDARFCEECGAPVESPAPPALPVPPPAVSVPPPATEPEPPTEPPTIADAARAAPRRSKGLPVALIAGTLIGIVAFGLFALGAWQAVKRFADSRLGAALGSAPAATGSEADGRGWDDDGPGDATGAVTDEGADVIVTVRDDFDGTFTGSSGLRAPGVLDEERDEHDDPAPPPGRGMEPSWPDPPPRLREDGDRTESIVRRTPVPRTPPAPEPPEERPRRPAPEKPAPSPPPERFPASASYESPPIPVTGYKAWYTIGADVAGVRVTRLRFQVTRQFDPVVEMENRRPDPAEIRLVVELVGEKGDVHRATGSAHLPGNGSGDVTLHFDGRVRDRRFENAISFRVHVQVEGR